MIDQTSLDGKVITAAFDLAASPGWHDVSLRDIADAAGCSLGEVMERFHDKSDVLKVFSQHVDRAMLDAASNVEREQTARDAVFEVIMSRFDLMTPYKAGLKSIVEADAAASFIPDPEQLRLSMQMQNKILQAAGVSAAGAPALVRQLGLARVYDQVFRIWLKDDDAGMARTMAALDRRLRQGEQTLRTLDDAAKASERICEQASTFVSRLVSAMRSAASRPNTDEPAKDEPYAPESEPTDPRGDGSTPAAPTP